MELHWVVSDGLTTDLHGVPLVGSNMCCAIVVDFQVVALLLVCFYDFIDGR